MDKFNFHSNQFVVPLLKGGDPTLLDNYRPISKLCILSKLLESFISEQLIQYLHSQTFVYQPIRIS